MTNLPIQLFNYENNEVRSLKKDDGSIWFVAVDICKVLDLNNVTKAVSRLEKDEVTTIQVTDSLGRNQDTNIINESGLYSLILTSKKKEAKVFKKWVTSEVLPSIRKTGSYNSQEKPKLPENYEEALEHLLLKVKENKKLENKLQEQKTLNEQLTPLAVYAQSSLNYIKKVPLSVFGKYLSQKVGKLGRNKISDFLIDKKLLFRNKKGVIEPYSQYLKADSNYQYFNLNPINYKKPVYVITKVNEQYIKSRVGEEVVTGFQVLILKSGMEKTIELAYKSGLFTNSEYLKVINDLPRWCNEVEYDQVKEFQEEINEVN